MLFVRNYDKPGFIGALGQALGDGRGQYRDIPSRPHRAGARTRSRWSQVDQPLTPSLIDTVRRLPNVIQAKAMRF